MELNYKASAIRKAEKANGISLFKAIEELTSSPSMTMLMFLLEAGGATEEQIDAFIAENGMQEGLVVAMGALAESGFLGKKISAEEIRKGMEESMATDQSTSISTGNSKKA